MERFVKGDVVVIDFPFSNLQKSKRRPVLILKVPNGEDLIVIQITGNTYNADLEIPLELKDFKKGTLNRISFLRIDKIASIEKSLIKYKIGNLKQNKFEEIVERIIYFLKE